MQRIEVRTPFEQVEEAFDQLASAVGPDRVTFLWDRPVDVGAPVGFRIGLADGTPVLEGGGTCAEMIDLGADAPRSARYRLVVTGLSLDAHNAESHGRIVDARRARTASRPPLGSAARGPRPSVVPARMNSAPPRASAPPPIPRAPSGSPVAARVFGKTSDPPLDPIDPHETPTVVAPLPRPEPPSAPPSGSRPSGYSVPAPPRMPAMSEDEPLELLVPRTLVARAEALLPRLRAAQSAPGRELASRDSLLRHALRMGLAALEAQADAEAEAEGAEMER